MGPFHLSFPLPRGWRLQLGWNTKGWYVRTPLNDEVYPSSRPELSYVHSLLNLAWSNCTPSPFKIGAIGSLNAHIGPLKLRVAILRKARRTLINGDLKQFFVKATLARWLWHYNLNPRTTPLAEIGKHLNYHHFIVGLAWVNGSKRLFSRDKMGMLVVHLGPLRLALHCPARGQRWDLEPGFMA